MLSVPFCAFLWLGIVSDWNDWRNTARAHRLPGRNLQARYGAAVKRWNASNRCRTGRLLYRFSRPWNGGTTHVILKPLELMEKLGAIVPAPKAHLARYSGILAPCRKMESLDRAGRNRRRVYARRSSSACS